MQNFINKFPGYEFINGVNIYRGVDVGKGGYVYHESNIYTNVALLDVQSMHPNSIISMNAFGEYTQNFKDMLDARVAIKHGEYDRAKTMLGGKLAPYLTDKDRAKDLSNALKTCLNSCYGLTAANFENPMRDIRNKNNFIALKGALLMKTLQDEVQARGFTVCHIKTDSIKVANATPEIIQFISDFAKPYGYTFEHEATYDRMCLVNGSTYIAKYASTEWCQKTYGYIPGDNAKAEKENKMWTATAKQFQVPFVFKTLFSKEPVVIEDLSETFEVKTAIYVDMNESLVDGEHDYHFVGKVGNFCPIKPGKGGGVLVKTKKLEDGTEKYDSVTGTLKPDKTPYRWLEAEAVKLLGKEDDIDKSYYRRLVDDAVEAISQYGDFERFVADEPYVQPTPIDESQFEHPLDADELSYYISPELEKLLEKDRIIADERPPWFSEEEWERFKLDPIAFQEYYDDTFKKR